MRRLLLLSIFISFISCNKSENITWVSISDDVKELADDTYEGRATGTAGELKAAAYIKQRFQQLNLSPKGTDGFEQRFSFKPSSNPHEKPSLSDSVAPGMTTARNILGYIDHQADKTVVIGAHYDHLGYGMQGSLFDGKDSIHNGADDNASGVALMLNLAYQLQNADSLKSNNYLFIAFSGEEMGLLGSNYFVKNPTIDLRMVNYMINLDMVGRLNEEKTISISGVGTSPVFSQSLNAVNDFGLKLVEKESGVGPSDHTSFYLNDIPVLHFFTGQHADYHKPS
ncbi:MAG: M28 family peptidase, partial [Flavobacteriaceae bacterium]|nr:M28 family peptidase [Flavobacteriaceae bacterium]